MITHVLDQDTRASSRLSTIAAQQPRLGMSLQATHLVLRPAMQPQAPHMSTLQLPQMVATQPNPPQHATPLPVPPPVDPQPSQDGAPNVDIVPLPLQYGPLNRDILVNAYFQQWIPKHPVDLSILQLENRIIDL